MKLWLWSWLRWILPCQWFLGRNCGYRCDGGILSDPLKSLDTLLKDKARPAAEPHLLKSLRFFGKKILQGVVAEEKSQELYRGWLMRKLVVAGLTKDKLMAGHDGVDKTNLGAGSQVVTECSSWWKPQDPCFGLGVSCPQQRHTRPIFLRMYWIYGLPRVKVWCHESKGCQQKTKLMKPTSFKKKQKL